MALALVAVTACVHHTVPTAPTAAVAFDRRSLWFDRRISPFPVLDSTGRALALPFLGGFEHPRPQILDIDGDGVVDLFIQEVSGQLALFQRGSSKAWELRDQRFHGLDIGEWYRFVDLDGDGLSDLFAESPLSNIRYYRNTGTRTAPRFVVAADTLRDVLGAVIYADRQNIAQFADIDCNGKLDMLLGRVDGTITRYEMENLDDLHAPRFRLLTERFEDIQIIGQRQPSLHGANTMSVFDVDADGDPDILWGDFFEPGLLWIRNQGSCTHPDFHGDRIPFPPPPAAPLETSGYNAPAAGDLNGDGRLDLAVGVLGGAFNPVKTSTANLYELDQTAPGVWTVTTTHLLDGLDLGAETIPAFADIDGDGDLDLAVGTKIEPENPRSGGLYWLENVGSRTAPAFRLRGHLNVLPAFHDAPAFGDLDGDGRPDLVVGQFQDAVAWYRNSGTAGAGRFVLVDSALVRLPRGSNAVPELHDIDADGDLDLFLGDASGRIAFFQNVGTAQVPRFTLVSDDYLGQRIGRRVVPRFVDLDGDGAAELVVGTEAGGVPAVFRGRVRDSSLTVGLPLYSAPAFADVRGTGTADVFAGGAGGGIVYFRADRSK
ncbi:MAG TPA: FG-GAP-like repeat-containing protein [Gemmatimonadales bacterium]|nr:FG-GAP-like repeat-containing protein [Gemmatimonadales bacterium]